jgi:hypothetical protein
MILGNTLGKPELFGFQVRVQLILRIAFEIRDIQTLLGKFVDLGQKFP